MKIKRVIISILFIVSTSILFGQVNSHSMQINISVSKEVQESFRPNGRLFVFLLQNPNLSPKNLEWAWTPGRDVFAKNVTEFNPNKVFKINSFEGWTTTTDWSFRKVPEGEYYLVVLWDQDTEEPRIGAPGNVYSETQKIELYNPVEVEVCLEKIITLQDVISHDLVRTIDIRSDTLSNWWGKAIHLKASVLLPNKYNENPKKEYPIRYNIGGGYARYTRINDIINDKPFMDWWHSDDAPQIINVFLDGFGPYGDCYQMDSDNNGPYGYSLINELIPYIEKEYRGTKSSKTRFVDGCSTGGWVSLALQLFYPDMFNGVYSYSPDPVSFDKFIMINIYKDKNAFINEYGYLRPLWKDMEGDPIISWKDFVQYENILGSSNSYITSGADIGHWTALYSNKGANGLPEPLFDPYTGEIDSIVAKSWKKYDLKLFTEKNWAILGPKLQGKIFIWMGDMDQVSLNLATREFDKFLKSTKNPTSDATTVFSPMEGHCAQFSHRSVLEKIDIKLKEMENK